RTVGEVRGFYAAERLAGYFATLDGAFVDAFVAPDTGAGELIGAALAAVRLPALLLVTDAASGSALAEGEAERVVAALSAELARFPRVGHRIHGLRPEPFLEACEPFLRRTRALSGP
ncbi:MAG: hypothetical protein ACRDF0_11570, partial [Candidatus Limnocylindria bacterium]